MSFDNKFDKYRLSKEQQKQIRAQPSEPAKGCLWIPLALWTLLELIV